MTLLAFIRNMKHVLETKCADNVAFKDML